MFCKIKTHKNNFTSEVIIDLNKAFNRDLSLCSALKRSCTVSCQISGIGLVYLQATNKMNISLGCLDFDVFYLMLLKHGDVYVNIVVVISDRNSYGNKGIRKKIH